MTTLKTSKIQFQGFYSKYSYKQFSEGGKEILYSGEILYPEELEKYGIIIKGFNTFKFIIIYRIKTI